MSVVRTCPLNIVMLSLVIVSARSMLACSVASTSCTSVCASLNKHLGICIGYVWIGYICIPSYPFTFAVFEMPTYPWLARLLW